MNRFNGDVYIVLTTREVKSTLMMSLTFCSVRNDRTSDIDDGSCVLLCEDRTSDVCETFSLRPEVVRCTVPDRTLRCHGKIIDDESYVLLREKRSYLRCV